MYHVETENGLIMRQDSRALILTQEKFNVKLNYEDFDLIPNQKQPEKNTITWIRYPIKMTIVVPKNCQAMKCIAADMAN